MSFPLQDVEGKSGKIVCFEAYGVRVGITSEYTSFLEKLASQINELFPVGIKNIENTDITQLFTVFKNGRKVGFQKNNEERSEAAKEDNVFKFLLTKIRLTVAEFAVSKVFVHAGVVIWKEKALVFPGNSFSGKTTLVRELIRRGAIYFSDEYAIFDHEGLVHPFPKTLSLRGIKNDYTQVEHTAEELGAKTGTEPRPVGMVLFSEFDEDAIWNPQPLSKGEGVLKIISFTLPIRIAPAFSLEVLHKSLERAAVCESKRGEAANVADELIDYFEKKL